MHDTPADYSNINKIQSSQMKFPTDLFRACKDLFPAFAALTILVFLVGCQEPRANWTPENHSQPQFSGELKAGDILKISFPGAPNLDTTQKIRPDGKITLSMVGEGELEVAGLTPAQVEAAIIEKLESQLQLKEVDVTLEQSANVVYVSGAVLQPGKILLERPMTALEAIMETGGFDLPKAKVKEVIVIRNDGDRRVQFKLNLEPALRGENSNPFYLKPYDIVFVPQKSSSLFDPNL